MIPKKTLAFHKKIIKLNKLILFNIVIIVINYSLFCSEPLTVYELATISQNRFQTMDFTQSTLHCKAPLLLFAQAPS